MCLAVSVWVYGIAGRLVLRGFELKQEMGGLEESHDHQDIGR